MNEDYRGFPTHNIFGYCRISQPERSHNSYSSTLYEVVCSLHIIIIRLKFFQNLPDQMIIFDQISEPNISWPTDATDIHQKEGIL